MSYSRYLCLLANSDVQHTLCCIFALFFFVLCTLWINVREYRRGNQKGQSRETDKKCLKIPKGQSESVYRRRTDNTMAKRKSTKGQNTEEKWQSKWMRFASYRIFSIDYGKMCISKDWFLFAIVWSHDH
jgi:hypothetical protein